MSEHGEVVELTGGQVLVRMLQAHGARAAFGIGGFQLLPYYDAMHDVAPALPHVLVKDERDGAFMADAYARVVGIPGVCDGTLGPGATNLITGLAESYGAGVPVIALAGRATRPSRDGMPRRSQTSWRCSGQPSRRPSGWNGSSACRSSFAAPTPSRPGGGPAPCC